MRVMDLGCGSGAFAPFIAKAVGKTGNVYAVDIQSAVLQQLERRLSQLENQDITNIELREASAV
ncbi:class I SAM-dependent methyltransferase [Chloroflexota bacterium]